MLSFKCPINTVSRDAESQTAMNLVLGWAKQIISKRIASVRTARGNRQQTLSALSVAEVYEERLLLSATAEGVGEAFMPSFPVFDSSNPGTPDWQPSYISGVSQVGLAMSDFAGTGTQPWQSLIDLDDVWSDPRFSSNNGSGSAIVIIDNGFDVGHTAFGPDTNSDGIADRVVYSYDFVGEDTNVSGNDGHGTFVASVAASSDYGVADGADLILLKVFADGSSMFDYDDLDLALQWVVNNASAYNVTAVNMSLGGGHTNSSIATAHSGVDASLSTLDSMGVVNVAASGNAFYQYRSNGVAYPSSRPEVLSVGATWEADEGSQEFEQINGVTRYHGRDLTTSADMITYFSQRSTTLTDVFAPGGRMQGAIPPGLSPYGNDYAWSSGTSFSSPVVAGLVSVAQDVAVEYLGRRLSLSEIRNLIDTTGVVINDGDGEYALSSALESNPTLIWNDLPYTNGNYKRIDAYALVEAIWEMREPENIFAQSADDGSWTVLSTDDTNTGFNSSTNTGWSSAVTWVNQNVGDFNGDGINDVVAMDDSNGEWFVSTGNSDGTLNAPTLWMTWLPSAGFTKAFVGDVNGDGYDDIVMRDEVGDGRWYVSNSDGSSFGTASFSTQWNPSVSWSDQTVVDINGDGKVDSVGRMDSTGYWYVNYANTSGGGFGYATHVLTWSTTVNWGETQFADVDGDGYVDIIGHNLDNGQLEVALNSGSGGGFFSTSTWETLSTSENWLDTEVGDFNGDGQADLVTRAQSTGELYVLLANTAGTGFEAEVVWGTLSTSNSWTDFLVGDFDGNGTDDFAARNSSNGEWTVGLSNGSTAFTLSSTAWATFSTSNAYRFVGTEKTQNYPQLIAADGDQIFAHDFNNADWTVLSPNMDANGFVSTIQSSWSSSVTWMYENVGDFNGDGHLDVTAMDLSNGEWFVSTGNSNGTLNAPVLWLTRMVDTSYNRPMVGDVDGDGLDDLIFRDATGNGRWYVGNSSGSSFGNPTFSVQWNPSLIWVNIDVGDFNNDGKVDVIGQQSSTGQWFVSFANSLGVGFDYAVSANFWNPNANFSEAQYGDFNGDGYLDFAGYQGQTGNVYVSRNNSGATFSPILWGSFSGSHTWIDWRSGDFNGDGKSDLLARSEQTGDVYVALANTTGTGFDTETVWANLSTSDSWVDFQIGDFDADGIDDIAVRNNDNGEWTVGLSNGTLSFTLSGTAWATYDPADAFSYVSTVHTETYPFNPLPGEQIFAQNLGTADWTVLTPNAGATAFDSSINSGWSDLITWVYQNVGDFNGDGYSDVIAMDDSTGEWYVSIGNIDGTLNDPTVWSTWLIPAGYIDPQVGDINGDGRDDLITRDATGNGRWYVSMSTSGGFGTATFSEQWNPSESWSDQTVADINGDGKVDVVGRMDSTGYWFISYANSGGVGFDYATHVLTWSTTVNWAEAQFADVDGDGYVDIIGHNLDNGQLEVALNSGSGGGFFSSSIWETLTTSNVWVDMEVGDFNGDGQADLVTRSQSTGELYVLLANTAGTGFEAEVVWGTLSTSNSWTDFLVGDFDGNGTDDFAARNSSNGEWTVGLSNGSTAFTLSSTAWATFSTSNTYSFVGMNNTDVAPVSSYATLAFFPSSFQQGNANEASYEIDETLFQAEQSSESNGVVNSETTEIQMSPVEKAQSENADPALWDAFEEIGELLF